jgi:hypothetical protein
LLRAKHLAIMQAFAISWFTPPSRKFNMNHSTLEATWNMVDTSGANLGTGSSAGQYDEHGRLLNIAGFF